MIQMLLSQGVSYASDIVLWGAFILVFLAFAGFIIYQRRQGKELRYELDQLTKMTENNIESEFLLRAMKIATWHADPKNFSVAYDDDFRDKDIVRGLVAGGALEGEIQQQLHPQDVGHVSEALTALCEGKTDDYHVVYRVLNPHTNKYFWEESFATVSEHDVDGKPNKIVGASMIVDERKNLETELIAARNRAEESDRLKSAFIANMSHEIRTPLNAIIGFTSVLPDLPDGEERQSLLDLINENTQKLLRIIDDVVNISKIESGQEQTVLSSFELNLTLSDHLDRYRHDLKPDVQLKTAFASDTQMITTDLNRFNEIIKHLLSNATKFTTSGFIEVGYEPPVDGRLRLWVRDTGKGIAESDSEKVFERFYKVDEFVPGAGLGLSICRTMAYSLGGTLTVESKLGEGSTFWLEIPIQ